MSTDFNKFSETYKNELEKSIKFSGQSAEFYTEIKAQHILRLTNKFKGKLNELNVLDFGCGIGHTDNFLAHKFGCLTGVDIANDAVEKAIKLNPSVIYKTYDGSKLPFKDNTFDIVFTICVVHHLSVKQRDHFIYEIKRVLKTDGLMMIFEHNPLNILTRYAVSNCSFDRDAVLINKSELKALLLRNELVVTDESYIIFFPFKGMFFRSIEIGLNRLPLGAQYYVVAKKCLQQNGI